MLKSIPVKAGVGCSALEHLLAGVPPHLRSGIGAISVAGTTTTSLLVDRISGRVLADPILYNEPQNAEIVALAQVGTVPQSKHHN